jgi:hypothetical protein
MEPTEKLVRYLRLAGLSQTLDISNIIAECIADGAVLDKPFMLYDYTPYLYVPPIFYAMYFQCPLNVVKQLKDAWWDDNYVYEREVKVRTRTSCCSQDGDYITITYTVNTIINELYSYAIDEFPVRNVKTCERMCEYARLFGNMNIIVDDIARHNYIHDINTYN